MSVNIGIGAITEVLISITSDWFLPSKDELEVMRDELYAHSVGGFTDAGYWSSTEINTGYAQAMYVFMSYTYGNANKDTLYRVRACRSFIDEVGAYSLRDTGPTGGLIFYIDGTGTTYYEAAPSDQSASQVWSNITDEIGVTAQGTVIGAGQANTTAIIGQSGHIDSAAKLCDDLTL